MPTEKKDDPQSLWDVFLFLLKPIPFKLQYFVLFISFIVMVTFMLWVTLTDNIKEKLWNKVITIEDTSTRIKQSKRSLIVKKGINEKNHRDQIKHLSTDKGTNPITEKNEKIYNSRAENKLQRSLSSSSDSSYVEITIWVDVNKSSEPLYINNQKVSLKKTSSLTAKKIDLLVNRDYNIRIGKCETQVRITSDSDVFPCNN